MKLWKWTISDTVEAEDLPEAVEKVTERLRTAEALAMVFRPLEGEVERPCD